MFNQITIIGLGLIGSSLARLIKEKSLAETLIAVDIDPEVCEKGMKLGLADRTTTSLSEGVKDSDFIIICTPVGVTGLVAQGIARSLKPGAIITDVGSVKQAVMDAMKPHLPNEVSFVPGHPIAGTEHSGPESGFSELFKKRWVILTPDAATDLKAIEKVTQFWESGEAIVEIMEPRHHDLILGITSHLPHLIAYTIVDTANNLEDDIKSEVIKYSASGFRGFTRIAASDPTMWRDVFLSNKRAVLEILQRFNEDLTAMQKAIRNDDGKYLYNAFSRTRKIRREVIELGEAGVPSPDREAKD